MGPVEVVVGVAAVVVVCFVAALLGARILRRVRQQRLDEADRGPDDDIWREEARERLRHVTAEWDGRVDGPGTTPPKTLHRESRKGWEGPAHGDGRPARTRSTALARTLTVVLLLAIVAVAAAAWVLRS